MEDGFRRSLGLGLWISKDEAWWIDLIGGSLRLGLWIPKATSDDRFKEILIAQAGVGETDAGDGWGIMEMKGIH